MPHLNDSDRNEVFIDLSRNLRETQYALEEKELEVISLQRKVAETQKQIREMEKIMGHEKRVSDLRLQGIELWFGVLEHINSLVNPEESEVSEIGLIYLPNRIATILRENDTMARNMPPDWDVFGTDL